jgi:hypothetical protein
VIYLGGEAHSFGAHRGWHGGIIFEAVELRPRIPAPLRRALPLIICPNGEAGRAPRTHPRLALVARRPRRFGPFQFRLNPFVEHEADFTLT